MPHSNSRSVRWLRSQLPQLVSAGVITNDAAAAIDRHYESQDDSGSRNIGVVFLAIIGSVLVAGGIILLIAHNWDDLSRPVRTFIAFAPLVIAQALAFFVLRSRDESQAWRESVAIFNVAAVATAISLVSQIYQVQGTFADFMCIWLLLSLPIIYLFRTTTGALTYIIGCVVWLFAEPFWNRGNSNRLFFWLFLAAIVPYYIAVARRDRFGLQTTFLSLFLAGAAAFGLESVAEFTRANLGTVAFAGLAAFVYLCGVKFFPRDDDRLSVLALLGGIGVGIAAIVLSFEGVWHFGGAYSWTAEGGPRAVGVAIQMLFPIAAAGVFVWDLARRNKTMFSIVAGALPFVAGIAWLIAYSAGAAERGSDNPHAFASSLLFDVYALLLGIELLARGVRANSTARANFGLLVIVALAFARFFDSDLSFVTRGLGFIAVGIGFLLTNFILFKKRAKA